MYTPKRIVNHKKDVFDGSYVSTDNDIMNTNDVVTRESRNEKFT